MKKYKLQIIILLVFSLLLTGCGEDILALWEMPEPETEELVEITEWEHIPGFTDKGYYYDHITDAQQIAYEHIYQSIINYEEKILCPMKKDIIKRAYESILYDHPEIFYCKGYTLSSYMREDGSTYIEYSTNYSRTKAQLGIDKKKIDNCTSNILSKIPYDWDDYEKIQYLYEYIVNNTTYQVNVSDEDNIISVFVNGVSVCEGYSKAFKYLCNKLGIECILVTGYINASGVPHMWNEVKLDDEWYFVDATWGDTDFKNDEGTPEVRYDYLCVTSDCLLQSHTLNSFVLLPNCIEIKNNYYYRNNLFVDSFDKTKIQEVLKPLNTSEKISFMCSDDIVYKEVYEYLIEDVWIFKYFPDSSNIKYSTNEETRTFTFWITD